MVLRIYGFSRFSFKCSLLASGRFNFTITWIDLCEVIQISARQRLGDRGIQKGLFKYQTIILSHIELIDGTSSDSRVYKSKLSYISLE